MVGVAPSTSTRLDSILDLIGNTPLVRLHRLSPREGVRIWVKLEGQNPTGSVKDRIAKAMIDAACADGSLAAGQTILEPTSGNTGLALALVGRLHGHPVRCVMPESVSLERRDLLRFYGADVVLSPGDLGSNGAVKMAQELYAQDPSVFMPMQYENADNPGAHYRTTGPEILRDCPEITHFVAGLGTGGTLTGVGRYLKEHKPTVKIVAAAPHPGDLVQGLRSMDEGYIPPVFDEAVLDGRIVVDSRTSFALTKRLLEDEGIFAGISSGAALRTAQRVAERMESGDIVVLLADGGWKYISTGLWERDYDDIAGDETIEGQLWW
ncbi:MAG: cysteine synthase B [Chloroflexi bacterium]|nr:MAG: cysteine synthase B [Chloroflexota bacterium]